MDLANILNIPEIPVDFDLVKMEKPRVFEAGSNFEFLMGPGHTVYALFCQLKGTLTADELTNLQLWFQRKNRRELGSGSTVDKENQYFGSPASSTNDFLQIWLCRNPAGSARFGETFNLTAIGMDPNAENPITSLQLKGAVAGSAESTVDMEVWALVGPATPTVAYFSTEVESFTYDANGSERLSRLFDDRNVAVESISLELSGVAIDDLNFEANGKDVFDEIPLDLYKEIVGTSRRRTYQSNLWMIEKGAVPFGYTKEPWIIGPDSKAKLDMTLSGISGSGTVTVRKKIIEAWG